MIEDELRAAFARHEDLVPDPVVVRGGIDAGIERRQRKRLRTGRLAAVAAAVVTLAAAPAVLARTTDAPLGIPFLGTQETDSVPSGPLNVLLLGVDNRQTPEDLGRADTIMVIHIPASHDKAYLVSIPKDTFVDIPGHGGAGTSMQKISTAHAYGGPALTSKVVSNLTGVRLDATAVVEYQGLAKVTDAVGGVEVCLPAQVRSIHTERVYPPGCSRFNGEQALDLLRQRFDLRYGDLDRISNGQEYLRGLLDRLTSGGVLGNPVRANEVLKAAGSAIRLDLGSIGLTGAVGLARRIRPADVIGISTAQYTYTDAIIQTPEGVEGFDPTTPLTTGLFQALRDDTLDDWAAEHPEAVRTRR